MEAKVSPPPAAKIATIQQIAETLGIHKSTVSLALAGKGRIAPGTRARVMALAEEIGYVPDPLAQRLANRSMSNTVCLCSGSLDPGRGTEKIILIQSLLTDMGLDVPIYTPSKSKDRSAETQAVLFRQLRRQRPQAIICSVHAFCDEAFSELAAFQEEGGIVVAYDLPIPLNCDQVLFDRVDNAYQGAKYLLDRGHRRIGFGMTRLTGGRNATQNRTQILRQEGFRKAMAEYGVPMHDEWFFENTTFERGGAQMAQHFLDLKDRPTALCIVNDYVSLAFMVEMMRHGVKVPKDVSIVGHDDMPIAAYCPVPLTSVSQPTEEIVRCVVDMLLDRLGGNTEPPRTVTVKGKLVERASVAAAPRGRK
jgi:DNA-binding LacI/PurR family transcriptional regulator